MIKPVRLEIVKYEPKMKVGHIYSIKTNKGIPDRFLVLSIVFNMGFKYSGVYESNPSKIVVITCKQMDSMMSKRYLDKHAPVYNTPMFNLRESEGFRWIANYKDIDKGRSRGDELAKYTNIADVRIVEGYDRNGKLDGTYGLWIRFVRQLDETFNEHPFLGQKVQEQMQRSGVFCEVIKTSTEPTGQVVFVLEK